MIASILLAVTVVAHDPGYTTSLANHIARWLGAESIPARVVTPSAMGLALKNERLAFLVGFATPSAAEMKTLKAFRARGGKLVVFHSAAPELAALMGVKSLGYAAAPYPGAWSRMNFDTTAFAGCPASVRQTSSVLMRAAPVKGRGRVIATWLDRRGRTAGDAAWIQTDAGWWMTHVLLADGDEDLKTQLVAALCAAVNPSLWNYAKHAARERQRLDALRAHASAQVPRQGEIHAVWDHSGCGLYPGDWRRTIALLADAGVTDLFVNFAGAGFAHYPSSVLPRSKTFADEGDQVAACLAAARGRGIRIHAWIVTFSATRGSPAVLADYAKRGWRLKTAKGTLTEYVDPANPSVRTMMLRAVDELQAKYPALAGIHLDFIRYGDSAVKPADAARQVTSFVLEARRRVLRPRWLTAAVYGKYPQCVRTVAQDWVAWLDARAVDYVVPMDYTESTMALTELLALQSLNRRNAARTIVGLGVTANESRLDGRKVIDQAVLARRAGFAGVSLFDLDATLEKGVLPYLKLGLWKRP